MTPCPVGDDSQKRLLFLFLGLFNTSIYTQESEIRGLDIKSMIYDVYTSVYEVRVENKCEKCEIKEKMSDRQHNSDLVQSTSQLKMGTL